MKLRPIRLDKHGQPVMTEKAFQATVVKALRVTGWEIYHTQFSIRSAPGFPDIIALHPAKHRQLAIEVKTETGRLRPEQNNWLEWFRDCGAESWLLRPSMFDEFWEAIK